MGVNIGSSTLRKSFISNQFSKYQHTNAEKREIAEMFMRTSVKYLDTNYNKIFDNRYKNNRHQEQDDNEIMPALLLDENNEVIQVKEEPIDDEEYEIPIRQARITNIQENIYDKQKNKQRNIIIS
jgi:hypothetical protein